MTTELSHKADGEAEGDTIKFPIVGVGASAGGLEAFKQLLKVLPPDLGMAFVLSPHLAPEHRSLMAEILARETPMSIVEVIDEPRIEPNRIYVIPPNRTMLLSNGHLKLLPREEQRGQHRSIDGFFRSLADELDHQAIGIILSGSGNDGTLGAEAIKAAGGITFAQDQSAQHGSMPHSAIAAGCIDFVLRPEAIAAELRGLASIRTFLKHSGSCNSWSLVNPMIKANSIRFSRCFTTRLELTSPNTDRPLSIDEYGEGWCFTTWIASAIT